MQMHPNAPTFILMADRSNCVGGMCRVVKEITLKWGYVYKEDVVIIAFDTDSLYGIRKIIERLICTYMQKSPNNDGDVEIAVWSSWCDSMLRYTPNGDMLRENDRCKIAETVNTLCHTNINPHDFIYIRPNENADYKLFAEKIRNLMGKPI